MKNFDRIERYLKGKMPADEQKIFEQEIRENESLREEVEIQKLEEELLSFGVKERIREELILVQNNPDMFSEEKKVWPVWVVHNAKRIAIAASVLLLFMVASFFYFNKAGIVPRIAQMESDLNPPLSYFDLPRTPGENPAIIRGLSTPINQVDPKNKDQLNLTIQELLSLQQNNQNDPFINYAIGAIYYELNQYETAFSYFIKVEEDTTSLQELREWAEFYHLLSLMQINEANLGFKTQMEKIKQKGSAHDFSKRLEAIEAKIKSD